MADRSEELFQSIETIAKGLIQDLKFNKTVICTIKDAKEAKDGKYYVTDGTSNFYAFCENTDYLVGQSVYVLIPNGDYSNQKIITGKYLADENEVYNYKWPWDSFVDITNNLYNQANILTGAQDHQSLIANGQLKEIPLWSNENLALKGYTTIGIKAEFKTLFEGLNIASGHYGIRIKVRFINDTTSSKKASSIIRQVEFNNEEMYGNTYNFETFYPQQKIFALSDPNKIIDKVWVTFFQDGDFKTVSGATAPAAALDNIFVRNAYLAFGYDLQSFAEDQVLLYTLNSSTYDATSTEEANKKILKLRWIHKTEDNILQCYDDESEDFSTQMRIHWYQYKLATGVTDPLAGNFWEEIPNALNKFQYEIYPSTLVAEEKYKVIIESPIAEFLLNDVNDTDLNNAANALEEAAAIYNDVLASYGESGIEEAQNILSGYSDSYDQAKENYELIASKYSVETQYYESNVLTLTNESLIANYASIDLVSGLQIECDLDGFNGVYTIYNSSNELQNSSESDKLRILTATFNSIITGQESLDTAERITWQIPLTNTMIQAPKDGFEYNLQEGDEYSLNDNGSYCYITRDGMKAAGDIGSSYPNATNQYFRIKPYLVEAATNNTISCYVTKNNLTYSASITLTFGTSGNSGTDYTLNLIWEPGESCLYTSEAYSSFGVSDDSGKPIRIDAHLYDENNNELTLNTVNFSWLAPGNLGEYLEKSPVCFCDANGNTKKTNGKNALTYNGTNGQCYIHYDKTLYEDTNNATNKNYERYHILKAEVTTETENVTSNGESLGYSVVLTAYLSIGISNNLNITRMEGCTKAIYNSLGTNPEYYTGAYKLFEGADEISTSQWDISIIDSQVGTLQSGDDSIINYYPRLEADKKDEYYYPVFPSMYFSATGICAAIGYKENKIVWMQPILIDQNHYQSALLNSWNNTLTIDEENGRILSTMLGAGHKDERNRFSGVLVGDIDETDQGVFGYHEGDQSFGFKTDGQAFIGKAGKGRILFDGNSGAIQSMSFAENPQGNLMTGMKIDLDDGIIEMHGVSNSLSSTAINNSDFRRHYDATSTAELPDAEKYIPSHSLVKISALSPYFYVSKAITTTNQMKPIFQIGDSESFIQTLDYDDGDQTGARITLSDTGSSSYVQVINPTGIPASQEYYQKNENNNSYYLSTDTSVNSETKYYKKIAYDSSGNIVTSSAKSSFEIKAYSDDGAVKMSSKSPFLWAAAMNSSAVRTPVFSIGATESFIQTVDYLPGKYTGARITLKGQDDNNINNKKPSFDIKAYSDVGGVKISSISPFIEAEVLTSTSTEYPNGRRVPVFSVGTNETFLQTADYNSKEQTGARITLKGANDSNANSSKPSFDIKAYSQTGGVKISSISPYLVAQAKTSTATKYVTLLNVGDNSYYLQSFNYTPATSSAVENGTANTTNGSGMKIDLANGKIIGYDFSLKAQENSGGYNGSYVAINSNGNSYLRIHLVSTAVYRIKQFNDYNLATGEELSHDNVSALFIYDEETNNYIHASGIWQEDQTYYELVTGNRSLDLVNISKNKFLLQSQDWDRVNGTGTQINLTSGRIFSYNFNLRAANPIGLGTIYINSNNKIYPFRIEGTAASYTGGSSSTYVHPKITTGDLGNSFFRIKWTGDFKAGNNSNYLQYEDGHFLIKGGKISGSEIEGSYIEGGELNIGDGFFYADNSKVEMGYWTVDSGNRGSLYYSQSGWEGSTTGLSGTLNKDGQLYMWAGYSGSQGNTSVFLVNNTSVYAKELIAGYTTNDNSTLRATANSVNITKIEGDSHYTNTTAGLGNALNTIYDSINIDFSWFNPLKRQDNTGDHPHCTDAVNEEPH